MFLCTLLYNAFKFESAAVSSSFTVFLRDLRLNDGTIFPLKRKRGVGAYTLCESCNTKTGSWYGSAYVELARQGMQYLQKVRLAGVFYLPFRIKPLRVIKQVLCMFACANGPELRRTKPELAHFVRKLRREALARRRSRVCLLFDRRPFSLIGPSRTFNRVRYQLSQEISILRNDLPSVRICFVTRFSSAR